MAELFQRDRSAISKHIKNIFEESELSKEGLCKFRDKPVEFYNLDVIISVGLPCEIKTRHAVQYIGDRNCVSQISARSRMSGIHSRAYHTPLVKPISFFSVIV